MQEFLSPTTFGGVRDEVLACLIIPAALVLGVAMSIRWRVQYRREGQATLATVLLLVGAVLVVVLSGCLLGVALRNGLLHGD